MRENEAKAAAVRLRSQLRMLRGRSGLKIADLVARVPAGRTQISHAFNDGTNTPNPLPSWQVIAAIASHLTADDSVLIALHALWEQANGSAGRNDVRVSNEGRLDGGKPAAADTPLEGLTPPPLTGRSRARRPLLFLSQRYTEKEPFARALVRRNAWRVATRRYFTSMGTAGQPSEGWLRLRQWLSQFDDMDTDDVEGLQELFDHQLVDAAAGPDAKLIRLIRWLAPDGPPMYCGRLVDAGNILAAAAEARSAKTADDDQLLFVKALWEQRLLPELARFPAGRGLDGIDIAWRAAHERYRAAEQRIGAALPRGLVVPETPARTPGIVVSLLSLVMDPEAESAILRDCVARTAHELQPVGWFGKAQAAAGEDPASMMALLPLTQPAFEEAQRMQREAADQQLAQRQREAHWQELEAQRTSSSAMRSVMVSAAAPFLAYAIVMVLFCTMSTASGPLSEPALFSMGFGAVLFVAQLVGEMRLAREVGAEYGRDYGLFSRASLGLQPDSSRAPSLGFGCALILLGGPVVVIVVGFPVILYMVLAAYHFRSVYRRWRMWRHQYATARSRNLTGRTV